jgi:hypothetical protein
MMAVEKIWKGVITALVLPIPSASVEVLADDAKIGFSIMCEERLFRVLFTH